MYWYWLLSLSLVVVEGVMVVVGDGGGGWRCLMVDMVGCGGWCWSEVKV